MAQVETLKKCFDSTDKEGNGFISATAIQMIFKSLGVPVQKAVLGEWQIRFLYLQNQFLDISDEAISELGDQMDANKFEFGNFCQVASRFMLEEDEEGMREELKEAFRSGILPSSRTKTPTHLFLVLPLGPKNEV